MQKQYKIVFTTLFFVVMTFVSFAQAGELDRFKGVKGNISIAGGTAHLGVMNELSRNIMRFNSSIRISVSGGGSTVGVRKVGTGIVDIGNSGRALKEKERSQYDLTSIPFAIDGIAVVVHPSNPVSNLTTEQAGKIFSGEIKNWQEVGGSDSEIKLFGRDENSATRDVFWKKLLHKGVISETINIIDSNNTMKIIVSWEKGAVGYMGLGLVDNKVKAVSIDGIVPSQENALSNKYFVVRKLYSNISKSPSQLTQLFIDYLKSSEGHKVISTSGYIPIN